MDRSDIKSGRPSKQMAHALSDHVLAVADTLFVEKGYGGTSISMIASRARVGKQTLYRRFPNKSALFREVVRRRIDAGFIAPESIAHGSNPMAELKVMTRAVLRIIINPDFLALYRIIIAEAAEFPELAHAASDSWGSAFSGRCADAIRRAQAMNICKPGDPAILAQCFLWSAIGDVFLKGLVAPSPSPGSSDSDVQFETVWRVLLEGVIAG